MGLPVLFNDYELLMWERGGFFVFLITSLFSDNYQKLLVHGSIVTFVVIYCLYVYNCLRAYWETDCEKLEATSDGVERVYLSSNGQRVVFINHLHRRLRGEQSKRKEIEMDFEEKLRIEKEKMAYERNKLLARFFKVETLAVVERFKAVEEEKEVIDNINQEKVLKLEEKCATLKEENINLADKLEEKRDNASKVEEKCTALEEEKDTIANELEEEQEKVWKLVEQCAALKKEKDNLSYELEKEQGKVSDLEEQCATLDEEKDNLAYELEDEQQKVSDLEKKCVTLEGEKDDLINEVEDLGYELEEERQKVSELEEKCSTLEEDKGNLPKELEDEKSKELVEMLRKGLLYISDKNDEQVKTLEATNKKLREVISERRKKMSKLEKKCKKLEEEKKVWEAEMVNSLVVIDSQESVIEAYKDMLNKEECLMKLFSENDAKHAAGSTI